MESLPLGSKRTIVSLKNMKFRAEAMMVQRCSGGGLRAGLEDTP